jgi:hypothetical protein
MPPIAVQAAVGRNQTDGVRKIRGPFEHALTGIAPLCSRTWPTRSGRKTELVETADDGGWREPDLCGDLFDRQLLFGVELGCLLWAQRCARSVPYASASH